MLTRLLSHGTSLEESTAAYFQFVHWTLTKGFNYKRETCFSSYPVFLHGYNPATLNFFTYLSKIKVEVWKDS